MHLSNYCRCNETTITNASVFRDHGINYVGFNVEEKEGINTSSSMAGSNMEARYKDFLRTFWRLSEQDGYPVVLREFEQVISLIQEDQRMTQKELNRPFSILSVDAQGNFSTFDPELLSVASDRYGTFNLGNSKRTASKNQCGWIHFSACFKT